LGQADLLSDELRDDRSGSHKVWRCRTCGHIQLFPLPSEEADAVFYSADRQARNIIPDFDFDVWRQKCAEDTDRRLQWLRGVQPPSARILDIGSGYGFFVDACVQAGYEAMGSDLSVQRVELASAHMRGTFHQGLVDEAFVEQFGQQFDTVTLFHVIEHLPRPVSFLQRCLELLRSGGKLLIEVPNGADALVYSCPPYRSFYWQRAHLSYFDAPRLDLVLRRAGFDEFTVKGVQRYGVRNLLQWVDVGKPQLAVTAEEAPNPVVLALEQAYKMHRELALTCDTLVVEVVA
jgi:SAM-dependent methyltransferase